MDNARNIMIIIAGVVTLLMTAFTVTSIGGRMHEAKKQQEAAQAEQKRQTDAAFGALDEVIGKSSSIEEVSK